MFDTLDYLRNGNEKQQRALSVIEQHNLFSILSPYDPLLAGTIPIGVDIASSDLDVLCCWKNREMFLEDMIEHFSAQQNFRLRVVNLRGRDSIVVNFKLEEFEVEIFGQNRPSREQEGFRHMVIEHELLLKHGEELRREVIRLKNEGMKTEPAFAKALNLEGDPYEALLRFE
jgi:hypothetical protein